ncbi:MAG TPA: phospholipase D-like domain-containing protein [Thermoanaerobaculia bacterium]|nr:phospholipase D-like domain-containing protein [Thermoanaerobaculia bacterium]
MIELPLWLFWLMVLAFAALGLMLYNNLHEVRFKVRVPEDLTRLEDGLCSLVGLSGAPMTAGNAVELLQNGDGFFPRLLADIAAAETSIHLETYVWWRGEICHQVAAALEARAREGVEVRVMLDALGAFTMERRLRRQMRRAGCRVEVYNRLRLYHLGVLNKRTHRKIAVFDGRIGYIFGHGIAQQWTGNGQDKDHWRDTGVRLRGPVVNMVQSVFCEHWVEETGQVLIGPRYFPTLERAGDLRMHVVSGSPKGGISDFELLFQVAIATAQHELIISNPYFIPNRAACDLLTKVARRGVEVKVMVPGPYLDSRLVRHAGHFRYGELLRDGVQMWEHQETLTHQKVIVIDGLVSHVGSTNLDDRSFDINEEAGVGILDEEVAAELKAAFEADLLKCKPLQAEDFAKHRFWHRLADAFCYQFNAQL